jgi:hypothetical protein
MVPDNSGPEDCCCDEEHDYLVVREALSLPSIGHISTDHFCGGPKEWEHSIALTGSNEVEVEVDKQQDSIEVTFTLSNALSEPMDPCFLFGPIFDRSLPDHGYKQCNFSAFFRANKIFPVDPFPWFRSGKKVRVIIKATHKTFGHIRINSLYGGGYSSYAVVRIDRCVFPPTYSYYLFPNYKDCTSKICFFPGFGTVPTVKCLSEDVELDKTVDLQNSHINVSVECFHSSENAFCFPQSASTKFTFSVEEVDP